MNEDTPGRVEVVLVMDRATLAKMADELDRLTDKYGVKVRVVAWPLPKEPE